MNPRRLPRRGDLSRSNMNRRQPDEGGGPGRLGIPGIGTPWGRLRVDHGGCCESNWRICSGCWRQWVVVGEGVVVSGVMA